MLAHNLIRAGAEDSKLMIEDCFQTVLYQGTGSSRTITNGLDMASGSMIWLKSRSAATDHAIYDTVRGATKDLASNLTTAQTTQATGVTGFGATGFSMGALAKINTNAATYAAWTFKKAPKFFDVVQVSHTNGSASTVTHTLGCAPGMVVAKDTGATSNWFTWHRGLTVSNNILLNTTAAQSTTSAYISVSGEAVTFSSAAPTGTYIFYLFAHDDSADGVVQCGSSTSDGSDCIVELGWEPQCVVMKRASDSTGGWYMLDTARGVTASAGGDNFLYANASTAEFASAGAFSINSSGFKMHVGSGTYIYLAIRRGPMRTPTDGTKVFNAIARTGTGAAATVTGVGFAPDVYTIKSRSATSEFFLTDRLRGDRTFSTSSYGAEESFAAYFSTTKEDGFSLTGAVQNSSGVTYIHHFFRRAPGFFDIVAYTGTGVSRPIAHGLKSVPGMMLVKCRSSSAYWEVWHSSLASNEVLTLNRDDAKHTDATSWNSTVPTESVFSIGTGGNVNNSGATYLAYIFGDTSGLCKSFSYTGNGSNQDIALGFAPRFVLIKRTDSTGDWRVFDSTRGIVSGNDPYLPLNSTAAEVTNTDYIDPISNGINVSGSLININGAHMIGWACA